MVSIKAKESTYVAKARRKLQEQIERESAFVTPQALTKMNHIIKHWINRHQADRIDLKDKAIQLFDENRHSTPSHSRYVNKLLKTLKNIEASHAPQSLSGRIRHARFPTR